MLFLDRLDLDMASKTYLYSNVPQPIPGYNASNVLQGELRCDFVCVPVCVIFDERVFSLLI